MSISNLIELLAVLAPLAGWVAQSLRKEFIRALNSNSAADRNYADKKIESLKDGIDINSEKLNRLEDELHQVHMVLLQLLSDRG